MFAEIDEEAPEVVHGVEALPTERLEAEIRETAAHIAAATCRWLSLVAEYDRREGWASWECLSCAHWVSWMCGVSMSTAHEHVRVARAVEALPLMQAGFASGELSYSKVRAITRVATPDTEPDLVELARTLTASQLDRTVRGYAQAERNAAPQPEIERRLSWEWNDDGSVTGRFHLGPDEGHELIAAVQRAVEADRQAQREEARAKGIAVDDERSLAEARADALLAVARAGLAADANTADVIVLPELLVHVEAEADGTVACQIDDGPNLHPAAAERLACDASVQVMIERDGDVLHVGRRTRKINRRLRRAVLRKTAGLCAFPGCATRARHIHHAIHWLHGGRTDIENLVPLCWRHHHAVHEGGWTLRQTSAGYAADKPWPPPDGPDLRTLASIPDPVTGDPRLRLLPGQPTTITAETPTPAWAGEPFDLHWVVDVLCHRSYVRTHLAATGTDG
jgi:hypothetical protein